MPDSLPPLLEDKVALWLAHLREQHGNAVEQLLELPLPAADVVRMIAVSEFAARHLLRDWAWFVAAASAGEFSSRMRTGQSTVVQCAAQPEFMQQLRRARNRTLLQILWRELQGASLTETLDSLSQLADSLISAAAEYARCDMAARYGVIRDADGDDVPLIIVAMGKLGGFELNFSSDIDLVFLYPEEGNSDGARPLAAQEYFARMARTVVTLLGEATADGFVYRVDTRLRPFGQSGPPVASYTALEAYLLNDGRSWERYAWLKARVIVPPAPHPAVNALHSELIDPFVYRRYLDFGVFESLREMKELVSAEVKRRDMVDNIKLGPGGIREIEFIVQALQLVRGGSIRGLRTTRLRTALARLEELGSLDTAAATGLAAAYAFLRRTENFLQAIRDQQVHDLPGDAEDRARLALAMGYAGWQPFADDIAGHRDFVSVQFQAIAFREPDDRGSDPLVTKTIALAEQKSAADDWERLLQESGLSGAADMANVLAAFLAERSTREAGATALRRLYKLLPAMLGELRSYPQPLPVLERLLKIAGQVLRRSAYLSLLNENRPILGQLAKLCEKSAFLAAEVARYPVLLDELLDPAQYSPQLNSTVFRDDLAERLGHLGDKDSEKRIEVIAQFQRAMLFRIAAADYLSDLNVMQVSDRLTELAEVVLEQALEIAWRDVAQRFGEPRFVQNGKGRPAGLGVIAYGKLGGMELSYGSDLDLVFLHDSRGEQQQTNGAQELDNSVFFARLARRLTHFLTTQTASGVLYEVDTRLRPSGRSGLLVSSVEAFERYQRDNAWTWEHQALLRARPVAGHASVARDFERIRESTLTMRVNRKSLRQDVLDMRAKMRSQLDKSDSALFDLKQGAGGIADIEFLVQFLVLQNARKFPAVIHYPDNIRQLGTLGASGCLDRDTVSELQENYRVFRHKLHKLLLNGLPPLVSIEEFGAERATVEGHWHRLLVAAGNPGS